MSTIVVDPAAGVNAGHCIPSSLRRFSSSQALTGFFFLGFQLSMNLHLFQCLLLPTQPTVRSRQRIMGFGALRIEPGSQRQVF